MGHRLKELSGSSTTPLASVDMSSDTYRLSPLMGSVTRVSSLCDIGNGKGART